MFSLINKISNWIILLVGVMFCNGLVFSQTKENVILDFSDQVDRLRANYPDSALVLNNKAFELSEEIQDTVLLLKTGTSLALVQNENGLSNKALGTIIELKGYLKGEFNQPQYISKVFLISGHINVDLNRFDDAVKDYFISLDMYSGMKDTIGVVSSYMGLGRVNSDQSKLSKAIYYYNLANEYSNDNNPHSEAEIHTNLGTVYARLGEFDKAESSYRIALAHYKEANAKRDIALIYYNLGFMFMDKGNSKLSVVEFQSSLDISIEINSAIDILWAHEGLYTVYKEIGESDKALYHHEKFTFIQDSLDNAQNEMNVHKLEAIFEKDKQDLIIKQQLEEIEDGNTREDLYKERIYRGKLEKRLLWFGIVMMIIFGFSGILIFLKLKNKNELLVEQKEVINKALYEKEILLKEIHHRVKNNLQIISSLLNLQSHRIDDIEIQEILEEGKNRVQAIALIHEKLYQSNNLSQVNFKDYLHDLLEQQKGVYMNPQKPIVCNINTQNVFLELDTAVPLGLIAAELITNAFKHGLKNNEKPILEVDLIITEGTNAVLTVRDNGEGLPKDFKIEEQESLGMEIIQALTEQIEGKVTFRNVIGAQFCISFDFSLQQ